MSMYSARSNAEAVGIISGENANFFSQLFIPLQLSHADLSEGISFRDTTTTTLYCYMRGKIQH